MKRFVAWALFLVLGVSVVTGCSEQTRKSMGADVNKTARDVDDSLD